MSRKVASKDSKNSKSINLKEYMGWVKWPVEIYLLLMLGLFPLYYENGYNKIGDVKYNFFKNTTLFMLALVVIALVFTLFFTKTASWLKDRMSLMDWAVAAYMAAAVFSWLISPYRGDAWIGSSGWNMGLLSQLLFIAVYFVISRFGTDRPWPLWVMGVGGVLAFLVAYLHRFNIDPLQFYEGLSDAQKLEFLGLFGQATWYSSYLCVVLPVMMGVYMAVGWEGTKIKKWARALAAGFIFLGFCSAVTQNSDSAFIGLGFAFLFLLWFALDDFRMWKQFVELVLLAVSAAKLTGLLQIMFPDRVPELELLSFLVTKAWGGWLVLAAVIVVYIVTCQAENGRIKIFKNNFHIYVRRFRMIFYIFIVLALLSFPVIIWMVTTGKVAGNGVLQQSGYLVFDENWGNGRGRSWSYCVRVFLEYSPFMKLFGCGPDALTFYSSAYHAQELQEMWGGLALTNAHNEWMTALINYGIIGMLAYGSIFIVTVIRVIKNRKAKPVLLAAGAAVLSYMGHNFFCYQQSCCTPFIFIVMGTAEYVVRSLKMAE